MNPFYQARGKFVAQADEIRPQYLDPDNVSGSAIFQANITRDVGPTLGASISAIDQEQLNQVGGLAELAVPWYSDQILPFDITLAASNEYGAMAGAKILGVEILNEGTGVSIDDTVTETQATFVARAVETAQTRSLFPFPLSATFPIRSRSRLRPGGQTMADQTVAGRCRMARRMPAFGHASQNGCRLPVQALMRYCAGHRGRWCVIGCLRERGKEGCSQIRNQKIGRRRSREDFKCLNRTRPTHLSGARPPPINRMNPIFSGNRNAATAPIH